MSVKVENGILVYLTGMMERSQKMAGYMNRVVYRQIIAAQRKRWMTEGVSEGGLWKPLNAKYRKRKLKRFASYPGGGRKMLIATNRLVDSMTGKNKNEHFKLATERRLEVGSLVPYAKYVGEVRDITSLSNKTRIEISKGIRDYLTGKK